MSLFDNRGPSAQLNPYEVHVTLPSLGQGPKALVQEIATQRGFSFSEIAGDDTFGPQKLGYLTTHARTYEDAMTRMTSLVDYLNTKGIDALRGKIEHIVFDCRLTRRTEPM